jgi:hypothetical protein
MICFPASCYSLSIITLVNPEDKDVKQNKKSELLGFQTLSIIRYSRKHNVSETEYVSVLRWGGGRETPTLLSPSEIANLNHWTDPVSETLCFLASIIADDEHSPKTQ